MSLKHQRSRANLRARMEVAQPSMADLTAQFAVINTAFAEFRTKNDAALAELRAGRDDVVTREQLERINATITAAQNAHDDLARRFATAGISADGGSVLTSEALAVHQAAMAYIKRGVAPQAAASAGSDPDGGYLVGEVIEAGIARVLGEVAVFRQLATVRSTSAPTYKKLKGYGGAGGGWIGETAARPATNTPTLGMLEFPVHELYAFPFATQTILDDAETNIEFWLSDETSITFDELEGDAFINGEGGDRPRGLIGGYEKVANVFGTFNPALGKVGYVVTGQSAGFVSGGSPTQGPIDCLINLQHALKQQVRNGASFLMADPTLATVRKFKDGEGNYIWQPSITAGEPSQLLGKPVATDDNMPAVGADAYAIAYGDFARAYLILDRVGIRVLRDAFTNKPYVGFYTTKRVGGGIQDFEAVKLLKFGTS